MSSVTLSSSALPKQKDSEFYFEDGNIILAPGCGRSDACLFRILMSQLAKQSEVFSDMAKIPPPNENDSSSGSELIECCPVIRMDDDPQELRNTFHLLWDVPSEIYDAATVLGVLRVASKYVMPKARAWAIRQLEILFPPSPEELFYKSHFEQYQKGQTAVELVLASHQCDTPAFFPYAYFALVTVDWSNRERLDQMGLNRLEGPCS
ncbi:hypothetical protein FRB94_014662 [Tulasnella sp. JGI-2019a]|nr:hypothetical protein FRB93_002448 [Tulasnella sp. JGI-2019a]KAG9007094.1 hypothetical protein FRB94_014662 [Tulasnella sp. JGI-2019a]KAG9033200.1 hypothetical protein FRB95_000455 [Tulasnella sp. JGI-2019a]